VSIVVTGASGHLGRSVVDHLLEKVEPSALVLVTRRPEALAHLAARGAEVRAGDFDEPASLAAAFAGGERLLLISTDAVGRRVEQHRAAVAAAVEAGVRSIAYTGMINPSDSNPCVVAPEHRETEEAIRASGLEWTFLRNAIYAEMLLPGAEAALAGGRLIGNSGDGRNGYVAREDCAAVAAAVLTSDGHSGRAYDITGPEALSVADVAALLSQLANREVEPLLLDDDAWVATMVEHAGMSEEGARAYATFGRAMRDGYAAPVSTAVQDLTGRPPRPVREVLEAALSPALR
jgi:NAD(P)H dehydrogenase (quinone)